MGRPLGQHFLRDQSVLRRTRDRIAQLYEAHGATTLIEIGPGHGALTRYVMDVSADFRVYEKDTTLKTSLHILLQPEQIIRGDVLEQPLPDDVDLSTTVVAGNLPYYITSPILRQFFEHQDVIGGVFLIQQEVAHKIMTDAPKKSYLRRLLNNRYTVRYGCTVPPKAFKPPPRVHSAVIILEHKGAPEIADTTELLRILELMSPYKRKTLGAIATLNTKKGQTLIMPDDLRPLRLEQLDRSAMRRIIEVNT